MFRRAVLAFLFCSAVVAGCGRRVPTTAPPVKRAFYYWRTTLRLSDLETKALAALAIDRLYLRVFDVDWSDEAHGPRPLGLLAGQAGVLPASIEIVPVVFVRERLFRRLDARGVARLADDVWRAVGGSLGQLGRHAREVEVDCDWTDASRAPYFDFLRALGERARPAGTLLGATIRLHQIKYRERTGVPPVARGMLMFYNMGRIDAEEATSAIYDPAAAERYLGRLADYPLPLDVGLPIWSWVVHVRGTEVEGLLQDVDPARLGGEPWLRLVSARRFAVTESAFLHGTLLRAGDFLDVEETTAATTRAAAETVAARLQGAHRPGTVALFHLSERNLANHDTAELARLFADFR
jgi:hypothetical protein